MHCSEAVIFDVDGLMIDSERLGYRLYQRIVAEYGCMLGDGHLPEIIGRDQFASAKTVIALTGVPLPPAVLNDLYQQRFKEGIAAELEPNPGLHDLLQELTRRRIPLGIASNSPMDYLTRVLATIQTNGAFRAVVSRDQVLHGKPAPDPYLRAAELLGVSPMACLAVEDSVVGMQSALAAGMRCAVVNETSAAPEFTPATARFTSLHALRAALDDLLCKSELGD